MNDILGQIRLANESGLYYVALFTALAVPDICAALESEDGETNGTRYRRWFDEWMPAHYRPFIDGKTCWQFRCSLMHQGSTIHNQSRYKRVLFLEPGSSMGRIHLGDANGALVIDVVEFCNDIGSAATRWWRDRSANEIVRSNLVMIVARHASGISPYIVGAPVIG